MIPVDIELCPRCNGWSYVKPRRAYARLLARVLTPLGYRLCTRCGWYRLAASHAPSVQEERYQLPILVFEGKQDRPEHRERVETPDEPTHPQPANESVSPDANAEPEVEPCVHQQIGDVLRRAEASARGAEDATLEVKAAVLRAGINRVYAILRQHRALENRDYLIRALALADLEIAVAVESRDPRSYELWSRNLVDIAGTIEAYGAEAPGAVTPRQDPERPSVDPPAQ